MRHFTRRDKVLIALVIVLGIAAGFGANDRWPAGLEFVCSAVALAGLAALVGRSVDALAGKLGPSRTGIVQSAVGNLPELFVCIFALQAGLVEVVQAAIVGSVLANVLLILGLAFLTGGLKHGSQRFSAFEARRIALLLLLSVAVFAFPTLTSALGTPAAGHEEAFSVVISIVLLVVFGAALVASLRSASKSEVLGEASPVRSGATQEAVQESMHGAWPFKVGVVMLIITGVGAAFVSDWFVGALTPTMDSLGIPEAFAGLVIVAIASNAVENVVGIQLAAKNKPDTALQVVLQSPLQVLMLVAPLLVLGAPLVGAAGFTLVLSPLLVATLLLSGLLAVLIVYDGESNWLEGAMLLGLYAVIATSFWWG